MKNLVEALRKVIALPKDMAEQYVRQHKSGFQKSKMTDESLQEFVNTQNITDPDDINDLMYDLERDFKIFNLKKPEPASKSAPTKETSVKVDFSNWETADTGDTTHYGGYAIVGNEKIQGYGTDRDGDVWTDIGISIIDQLGVDVENDPAFEDIHDQVMEVVHLLDSEPAKRTIALKDGKVTIPGILDES